jgi:hypothetical protein
MLQKDYDHNGSVEKRKRISGCKSQGAWYKDELNVGKPSVIKWL